MPKIILTDTQKTKFIKGICVTPFCMKKATLNKSYCASCRKKVWQKNNPLRYTFSVKKNNSKRKKKYFSLTFEEFCELAKEIDYMNKKGTKAKSMTIDREKDCTPECPKEFCKEHGYTKDNVQGLTLRENIYKYKQHKRVCSQVPF